MYFELNHFSTDLAVWFSQAPAGVEIALDLKSETMGPSQDDAMSH